MQRIQLELNRIIETVHPTDRSLESRRSARVSFTGQIECSGKAGTIRSDGGDLSTGGMFLEISRTPFTTGADVVLSFVLPGSPERVVSPAEVRYVQDAMGIGVQFLALGGEDHDKISRFVADASFHAASKRNEETRRSSRVSVNLPVTLRSIGADGAGFDLQTEIVTLSKYGACLRLKGPVQVGMQVRLFTSKGLEFKASVAWLGDDSRPQSRGQFGVQSRGLAQALGFRFP